MYGAFNNASTVGFYMSLSIYVFAISSYLYFIAVLLYARFMPLIETFCLDLVYGCNKPSRFLFSAYQRLSTARDKIS